MAASRWMARNPLGASATSVPLATFTTQLPKRWRRRFRGEKWAISAMGRSPTTMSALPSRIGRTRAGMEAALY